MSQMLLDRSAESAGGEKVTVVEEYFRLTANDRCDRCGAQAYFEVTLMSDSKLLFCAHHYREVEPGLVPVAKHVRDESGQLHQRPNTDDD